MHYIGIDVSKKKLHISLLRDATEKKFKPKSLPNTDEGHRELIDWAARQTQADLSDIHIVVESTGVYHQAVAIAIYEAGAHVSVINPAQVKHFGKGLGINTKTDLRDAEVLALYGDFAKPTRWQPPPPEVVELKALIARLEAVEMDIRRELNRQEKAEATPVPKPVKSSLKKSIDFLEKERDRLTKAINDHIDNHPGLSADHELLTSIPGVGPKTAQRMMAVLRSHDFKKASQVAAYLGLVPIEHESGTSVKRRPRLSKAGDKRARAALYMAAIVATRHNPDIREQYLRLQANGKCKMAALGAAMRKLVQICFGVLKHAQPYQSRVAGLANP